MCSIPHNIIQVDLPIAELNGGKTSKALVGICISNTAVH